MAMSEERMKRIQEQKKALTGMAVEKGIIGEGKLQPLGVEKEKSKKQEKLANLPAEELAKAIRKLLMEDMDGEL